MDQNFKRMMATLRSLFRKEDTRFIIATGLKVMLISFIIHAIVYTFIYEMLKLNYAFFKAHGFQKIGDEVVYFDYILNSSIENLTLVFLSHIFIFFIGTYIGWLILRPFKQLGEYCDKVIEDPDYPFKMEYFTTHKLLINFSEIFFDHLRECRKNEKFTPKSIPPQYMGIHGPVQDKIFIFHFGLLLALVLVSVNLFMIETTTSIFESLVELASTYLSSAPNNFFTAQLFLIEDITWLIISMSTVAYLSLGIHLYSKVSGAAFGIFSTMRSYTKGKRFSRVHLLGYEYVRDHTRKINRYLDYLQNQLK